MSILSNCYCMDEAGREFCKINDGDIVIIGFNKCGTVTLEEYLRRIKPDKKIHRREIIYSDLSELKKYKNCTIVAITRDPIERLWSMYNYYEFVQTESFESWVMNKRPLNSTGTNSPIESCRYEKYTSKIKDIIVYKLEDMPKDLVLNKNDKKPEIPKETSDFIEMMLDG